MYHTYEPNVGQYTSPMDPMGYCIEPNYIDFQADPVQFVRLVFCHVFLNNPGRETHGNPMATPKPETIPIRNRCLKKPWLGLINPENMIHTPEK